MIPLKILPGARGAPHLTRLLVALNLLAFGAQLLFWWRDQTDLALIYGVRSHCYFSVCDSGWPQKPPFLPLSDSQTHLLFSPFSALFLHADWAHLGFNLLFLLVFGGALEENIGRVRFALVYFVGGLMATFAHIVFHPTSQSVAIGASGAIAALLGAALLQAPRAWVLTYFPPYFFFPLPAPLFLIAWMALQIGGALSQFPAFGRASAGVEIAWMAHLGGFCFGAFYGWKIAKSKPKKRKKRRKTAGSSSQRPVAGAQSEIMGK